jgi:hypothetical protein
MPIEQLSDLAALHGSHAVVYHGMIDHEAPRVLYEHLRHLGRVPRLDLVIATNGGTATAARRLALLLHEYTDRLTVLVPHRARSAGTLLCLGAHELVLGPLAELSPLDPQIGSAAGPRPGEPAAISAEDVRAFRDMSEQWFGVVRDEDRLSLFGLLAQRVFPGSLGAFYRADRLIRDLAHELLAYQLPDIDAAGRDLIADRLVAGFHAHDYAITRAQAKDLGLRVRYADAQEEALLWTILRQCDTQLEVESDDRRVVTLMAGKDFFARRVQAEASPGTGTNLRWRME